MRSETGLRTAVYPGQGKYESLEYKKMIPLVEMERLLVAAVTASALAQSGQKRIGREWLEAGYRQALESQLEGQKWAPSLVRRWQQVLDAYCAQQDLPWAAKSEDAGPRERNLALLTSSD